MCLISYPLSFVSWLVLRFEKFPVCLRSRIIPMDFFTIAGFT